MKKSLVLAMAMALGVSATAFAANPFSDLPAGHWAYASVAKLAAAGIVDGYPDGTYKGSKLMTRYEMAQIVAKALAKGAIGADDKLVSEFADELDNLGVRVAKLEKNADNVKITGQARFSYDHAKYAAKGSADSKEHSADLRTRLFFTGEVNDDWHYQAMLQNNQNFTNDGDDKKGGDEGTSFQRAFLTGNLFGAKATAGRYNETIAGGNLYDHRVDGAKLEIGNALKLTGEIGKMAQANDAHVAGKFLNVGLAGEVGNFDVYGNYVKVKDIDTKWMAGDDKVYLFGLGYDAKNFGLNAEYLHGDNDGVEATGGSQTGWAAGLTVMGAKAAQPGTWGLSANYYNQGASTVIAHTMDGHYDSVLEAAGSKGFKGYKVGANLTVAKNMVAGVDYYDLKGKEESDNTAKSIWSTLYITF